MFQSEWLMLDIISLGVYRFSTTAVKELERIEAFLFLALLGSHHSGKRCSYISRKFPPEPSANSAREMLLLDIQLHQHCHKCANLVSRADTSRASGRQIKTHVQMYCQATSISGNSGLCVI